MLALFVRLLGCWVSGIEQDGVERTINAIDGIVVRVIGRSVSESPKQLRHSRISTVEPRSKVSLSNPRSHGPW